MCRRKVFLFIMWISCFDNNDAIYNSHYLIISKIRLLSVVLSLDLTTMFFCYCLSFFLTLILLISSIGSEYIKIQNKLCTPFMLLGGGNMSEYEAKRLCTKDIHCTKMFKKRNSHEFSKCTIHSTMLPNMDFIVYSKGICYLKTKSITSSLIFWCYIHVVFHITFVLLS